MTYILVKSDLIEVHRIRPSCIIPNISGLYIEPLWPYTVVLLWAIALEACGNDIKYTAMVSDRGRPHTPARLWGVDLELTEPR